MKHTESISASCTARYHSESQLVWSRLAWEAEQLRSEGKSLSTAAVEATKIGVKKGWLDEASLFDSKHKSYEDAIERGYLFEAAHLESMDTAKKFGVPLGSVISAFVKERRKSKESHPCRDQDSMVHRIMSLLSIDQDAEAKAVTERIMSLRAGKHRKTRRHVQKKTRCSVQEDVEKILRLITRFEVKEIVSQARFGSLRLSDYCNH